MDKNLVNLFTFRSESITNNDQTWVWNYKSKSMWDLLKITIKEYKYNNKIKYVFEFPSM